MADFADEDDGIHAEVQEAMGVDGEDEQGDPEADWLDVEDEGVGWLTCVYISIPRVVGIQVFIHYVYMSIRVVGIQAFIHVYGFVSHHEYLTL